jgi:hypothetical protein
MEEEVARVLRLARYLLQKNEFPSRKKGAGQKVARAYSYLRHSRYRIENNVASPEERAVVDEYLGGSVTFLSTEKLKGEAMHMRLRDVCCASAGCEGSAPPWLWLKMDPIVYLRCCSCLYSVPGQDR